MAPTVITCAADWRGAELADAGSWARGFSPAQIAEIDAAYRHARTRGATLETLTEHDFPLPTLAAEFADLRRALEDGLGLRLYRGFPVERYDAAALRLIYWGLGLHIGTPVAQSRRGDMLGDVRDLGDDIAAPAGRAYTSRNALNVHTDGCDATALFCLRRAKAGGLSRIVSAVAVHNEIARRRPDLLEVLYRPFWWSWQRQQDPGAEPFYAQPVFGVADGRLAARFVRTNIIHAEANAGAPPMTDAQREAIDFLVAVADEPGMGLEMMFAPGDIQLLNNHITFHTRTAFEDWPEPARKRHLLRLWLSLPNSRRLPESFRPFFRDVRPGAVRGGFPYAGPPVFETAGAADTHLA